MKRPLGLTLIEVTIALAIAAVLFAAAVMGVGALTGTKAKAAAGELGGVIRAMYDTAALSGKTCRLVFEMPAGKDDGQPAKYWAECASGNITSRKDRDAELRELSRPDERDERKSERRERGIGEGPSLQELLAAEKDRVDQVARFAQFTSPEIEQRELPPAVSLGVWTKHQRRVAESGTAFLYFFPQGFTEKAQIYVRQGSNVWTITVQPLTGKVAVVADELEVPRS
ncbi:MAG: prepilin-type N-terminal cleavage/methylation domain-containing protein [Myxococcales bacterium]|nr:prepilin-type N-terminal cleavage/methylation domain-containing protein [Myxococcales bacterium]